MNSTTSDFTELRKSLEKESYGRGTLSSAKRRPFFPRKLVNLTPLNLNEIKREVEAEKNRSMRFNFIESDDSESTTECEASEVCDNTLRDISNTVETVEKSEAVFIPSLNEESTKLSISEETRHNEPENKTESNTRRTQSNDSFDLDFSALSLSTPVRQREKPSTTPKVNNTLPVCQEAQVSRFERFVTPKVKNVLPAKSKLSVTKKNPLATPNNHLKNNHVKAATPFGNNTAASAKTGATGDNVLYTMPKQVLKDDTFSQIVVKQSKYLVLGLLGRGGSSEVFQCYNLVNKQLVAIKCVSFQNSSASSYINEVKLLQQLQYCDKIIKMYDFEILTAEKKLYMVLERGGDDLSTILKKLASQRAHIPIYTLLFYWMDMLHAVRQIHSHGVIHSDLKPSNFIKAEGGLKLIDFGIASSVQNDETSVFKTIAEGSCNYISPEALNNDSSSSVSSQARYKVHYKSDVWSLGCILYQLVYRRTPFNHLNHLWTKLAYILNPEHKIEYPEVNWVSPRILDTIKKCLQYNVKSRPSVDELIEEYEAKLLNI